MKVGIEWEFSIYDCQEMSLLNFLRLVEISSRFFFYVFNTLYNKRRGESTAARLRFRYLSSRGVCSISFPISNLQTETGSFALPLAATRNKGVAQNIKRKAWKEDCTLTRSTWYLFALKMLLAFHLETLVLLLCSHHPDSIVCVCRSAVQGEG